MTATLHSPDGIEAEQQESASVLPEPPSSHFLQNQLRRLPSLLALVWQQSRRVPATVCFLVAVWGAGLVTDSIVHGPSRGLTGHVGGGVPSIGHAHWWTPFSADLIQSGLVSYLAVTALGLLILAPAEHRLGTVRTVTTLVASQAIGILLADGLIRLADPAREPLLGALTRDSGLLPGVLGVCFAVSFTLTPRWRTRLQLLLIVAITLNAMYVGHLQPIAQACGAATGLVITATTYDGYRPWAGRRASQREIRSLVGILVAVPALGDMVAALVANAHGPMSLSSSLLSAQGANQRDLVAACSHAQLSLACRGLSGQQLYVQWPGWLVEAAPVLLVLVSAYWLRRGRRLAWWLAVVINLTVLGVSIWAAYAVSSDPDVDVRVPATAPSRAAMLLPFVTLIVLLVTRRHFDQTDERWAVRKLTATLATALCVSCGAFLLLGYMLGDQYSPRSAFGVPTRDLPMRFVESMLFSNHFLPGDLAGRVFYLWVFLLAWVVVLGALTAFFLHTSPGEDAHAAVRARAILMRGGSTLSYMSTWRGNKYWFSSDGRAAIAYRAIAGVAVTVGEPYGDPAALDSAIAEFTGFCENRGLQPCLYSVSVRARAATQRLGWKSVQVAEDTLIPLEHLQFNGQKWQKVRTALNKAAREGITAEWCSYPEAPADLADQIREISGKWTAEKGLPEMGFTLGGLEELNDPNIRCLIAVGTDRKIHAFTSWLPVYENGQPVGWTLDLMRRNSGASHGVMEFLIAAAAQAFQKEGARFISLSGAPLARLDRGEQPCPVQRLLDKIAYAMEPVYGFQSLLQFKEKFNPDYQPLYLTYPDPAAIGSIAAAISRAYLPDLTSRQALRLLTRLRWPRLSRTPATASH